MTDSQMAYGWITLVLLAASLVMILLLLRFARKWVLMAIRIDAHASAEAQRHHDEMRELTRIERELGLLDSAVMGLKVANRAADILDRREAERGHHN